MKIETLHQYFINSNGVTTDSRKVKNNQIYFALKGENFNGNNFANSAIECGALLAIVDEASDFFLNNSKIILVNDCLKTLQELANYHRKYLNIPVIALTGSNGKTTTKELINEVLKQKFKTSATIGNLNNHIGVPLTLLSFNNETEIGIVEMGANHQNEIEMLCNIAEPDYGYITNFGKAHLEGFGGIEGVIKGKSEMYSYLKNNNKVAFYNADDKLQVEKTTDIKNYGFSIKNKNSNIKFDSAEAIPNVIIKYHGIDVKSNLIGIYNTPNIFAAITIGKYFEVNDLKIKEAIETYVPTNNRSQILKIGNNEIILDAYNANPSSMEVALKNIDLLNSVSKITILGDMFELGIESNIEHRNVIEKAINTTINKIIFIGENFYNAKIENNKVIYYKTFEDFKNDFSFSDYEFTTILIKGSRGMALERILN